MHLKNRIAAVAVLAAGLAIQPAQAQTVMTHGYATQAYGQTSDYAQAGLPVDGTADLRAMALQARVLFFSTGTQVVAQGAHRRVGGSPIAALIDDVELDWAFVEQRIGDFSARVGRVPIPKGLLNEVRDVGTILPFYQASKAFYTDGIETVDGATARFSRSFGDVDIEAQGFHGTIPIVISLAGEDGPQAIDEDGEGTFGGQFSVGLPVHGLKALGGILDSDVPIETPFGPSELDWEFKWAALEYQGERVFARAEQSWSFVPTFQRSQSYYVQAGFNVWGDLWVNAQREHSTSAILSNPQAEFEYDPVQEWAVGASYRVSPMLVVKAEQHISDGYNLDELVNVLAPGPRNNYFLLSVSAAF